MYHYPEKWSINLYGSIHMKYLLDTCVISELVKSKPDKKVVSWIKKNDEDDLCLSSLTFGELYKGIAKLPDSTRREKLSHWIEHDLKERFAGKIFAVDRPVAKTWGGDTRGI
jgi:predicted nucleic acid-binding protein